VDIEVWAQQTTNKISEIFASDKNSTTRLPDRFPIIQTSVQVKSTPSETDSTEKKIRNIRCQTRKKYSARKPPAEGQGGARA